MTRSGINRILFMGVLVASTVTAKFVLARDDLTGGNVEAQGELVCEDPSYWPGGLADIRCED